MAVRYPRCWLDIGGIKLKCLSASCTRTAQRQGDTFTALLSITHTARSGMNLAYWTDFQPTDVSLIMASAPGSADERVMVEGLIDMPAVGLKAHTVSVSGRDRSASLTEKRRNEKFANQKPKDIAGKIAKDHGLTLQFKGDGSFAGKAYDQEHAFLALNPTDFEILSQVAESIGYRWYVSGKDLYLEPKAEGAGSFDVVWVPPQPGRPAQGNVLDLSLRRNMSAARPHRVLVKSWHNRSRKLFKYESKTDGIGNPLAYEYHHNGKTQAQVEALAKSRLKDRIRHELGVTVQAPGDLTVDVRQALNLSGTGTIYDQPYEIDRVTWDMTYGQEFGMVIEANAAKQGRQGADGGAGSGGTGGTGGSTPLPPRRPVELGGSVDV